jgi:aryl-alcohol dehydrogenase-like predicted oxidoreductase
MNNRYFGKLGSVSALSLGGGGIGQVWGPTTREESVSTTLEAVKHGINLLDMAPSYGKGEAESVIGEAFKGALPKGVLTTTKCRVGDTPPAEIFTLLDKSINASLERMKLDHVDILFLHNWISADDVPAYRHNTPRSSFENAVIPAMKRIVESGRARAWGLTGVGDSAVLIDMLTSGIQPDFIQVVTNLLDSAGGMTYPNYPAQPRNIISAAQSAGTFVMGIRAVQAGALTSKFDRFKSPDDPEMLDFQNAAPFRAIAKEIGQSPAFLAHQYALSMDGPATIVLGVKNREELHECLSAEAAGPMDPKLIQRIDQAVG